MSENTPGEHAAVIERVKAALRATTLQEVSIALGEPLGTVKGWSARGTVPVSALRQVKRLTHKSLDWLLDGDNPSPLAANASHGSSTGVHRVESPPPADYRPRQVLGGETSIDGRRLARAIDIVRAVGAKLEREMTSHEIGDCAAVVYSLLAPPDR